MAIDSGSGVDRADRGRATMLGAGSRRRLRRRGFVLEGVTLAWNVIGVFVLAIGALTAGSVALIGFGADSLIEITASVVVIWELSDVSQARRVRAMRLIGMAFFALSVYLAVQSTWALVVGDRAHHSALGIVWTAMTAVAMLALAYGKDRTGRALGNEVLRTEGRVTLVDGILAVAVLTGLVLNATLGWWSADPAAAYVVVYYAAREARSALTAE